MGNQWDEVKEKAKEKGYSVFENKEYEGIEGIIKSVSFEKGSTIYDVYEIDTFEKKLLLRKIENGNIDNILDEENNEKGKNKVIEILIRKL